jgi:hypothetical protein
VRFLRGACIGDGARREAGAKNATGPEGGAPAPAERARGVCEAAVSELVHSVHELINAAVCMGRAPARDRKTSMTWNPRRPSPASRPVGQRASGASRSTRPNKCARPRRAEQRAAAPRVRLRTPMRTHRPLPRRARMSRRPSRLHSSQPPSGPRPHHRLVSPRQCGAHRPRRVLSLASRAHRTATAQKAADPEPLRRVDSAPSCAGGRPPPRRGQCPWLTAPSVPAPSR